MPVFSLIQSWFTDEPTPEPYLPGLNPNLTPPPKGYDSWIQYSIAERGATLEDESGKKISDENISRGWEVAGMSDFELSMDLLPGVAKDHFGGLLDELKKYVYIIGGIAVAVIILK